MLPRLCWGGIRSARRVHGQGFLQCMYELQEMLQVVTWHAGVSLTPMAGAQGELRRRCDDHVRITMPTAISDSDRNHRS